METFTSYNLENNILALLPLKLKYLSCLMRLVPLNHLFHADFIFNGSTVF